MEVTDEELKNYYYFGDYYDGFAIVQKKEDGKWKYRDVNGNLSKESFEFYYYAAKIDPKTLTYKSSKEIDIYSLSSREILENLDKIKELLKNEYQRMLSVCSTKEQREKVVEICKKQTEYIKSMAYEAYEEQKNSAEYDNIELF